MSGLESTSSIYEQVTFGLFIFLVVSITAGVGYLTYSDWRDKRRRKLEESEKSRGRRKR